MKHLIPALLIVICTALPSFGGEWRPTLGVGLRQDIVIAQQGIREYNEAYIEPAYYPLGGHVRAGLTSDYVSGYLDYFMGHSPTIWPNSDTENRWDTQQFTLGGRWFPAGRTGQPWVAFIGGGVTLTNSRYDATNYIFNPPEEYPSRSRNDLGALLEFGSLLPVTSTLQFSLSTQLHRFEASFGEGNHYHALPHYVVLMPAFLLTVEGIGPRVF